MPVYLAPVDVDDEGGGDNDDIDDLENQDDDDEEADDDEADDDDEEADDDDPENQDDDEGDDDDDDEGDKDLGKGAQKRIRQLVEQKNTAQSRVKDLEKQLEEAKKLSGDDGRALLAAAEATGILPGLMTKDEAKAFQDIAEIPQVIERYQDWLDENERDAELELGNGSTMSYGDVKKRVRKLRAQLEDLKDRYGDRRKELTAKVRGIFETGLAAMKAGWKPDGKKTPKKKTKKALKEDRAEGIRPSLAKKGRSRVEDIEVEDEDSLEAYMAAENRREKRRRG
jgi:hypothetical protein